MTVYSNGWLTFNFGWLNGTGPAEALRDRLRDLLVAKFNLDLQENYRDRFVSMKAAEWVKRRGEIVTIIREVVEGSRAGMGEMQA